MPTLAREYNIRPWELDELTDGEVVRMWADAELRAEYADPDSKTNKARKDNEQKAQDAGAWLLRDKAG